MAWQTSMQLRCSSRTTFSRDDPSTTRRISNRLFAASPLRRNSPSVSTRHTPLTPPPSPFSSTKLHACWMNEATCREHWLRKGGIVHSVPSVVECVVLREVDECAECAVLDECAALAALAECAVLDECAALAALAECAVLDTLSELTPSNEKGTASRRSPRRMERRFVESSFAEA